MKKIIFKSTIVLTILFLGLTFFAGAPKKALAVTSSIRQDAFNQLDSAAGPDGAGFGEYHDPRETTARIIRQALGLIGLIFLVLTLYAGYLWMTASGEEENVTKAKNILRTSIIGLIIILAAYSITNFVIFRLFRSTVGGSDDPLRNDFCLRNPDDETCVAQFNF